MFTRGSFRYPYIVRLMGTASLLCLASVAGGRQVGDSIPIYLLITILVLNYWMIGSNLSTIFLFYIFNGNNMSWWYILNFDYLVLSGVELLLAVCRLVSKYDKFYIIRKSKIYLMNRNISSIKLEYMSGMLVSFEFNWWYLEVCECMCVLIFFFLCFILFFFLLFFFFLFFNFCCAEFFY